MDDAVDLSGIREQPVHNNLSDQPSAENLARLILDTAEEGFCLFSANEQRVVAYNRQFADYLNLDPNWLATQPTAEEVAKAVYDREQHRPGQNLTGYLRRVLERHRRAGDWEIEFRLADGRTIVGRTQAASTGERLYTARDVTHHRRIVSELEQERQRLSSMVEHAPVAYYVMDCTSGRIVEVSRSIEFLTGRPIEIYSESADAWLKNVHEADIDFVRKHHELAIREQLSFDIQYRRIHADGTARWFREMAEAIPRRSDRSAPPREMAGVLIDIGRQKVAEARLRESERRFRELIEGIPDLIFYEHDPDRRLTYVSPSVKDVLEFAPHEMVGKRFGEIHHADPDVDLEQAHRFVAEAIRTGRRQPRYEIRVRNKDGDFVILEIHEYPVADARGVVVGFRGVARDITTIRTMERRLRERERLAILGTFAGGLAHDLNNLLLPIRASLETLERNPVPTTVTERANAIRQATDLIGDLVKKLLFWTKQDASMASRAIITNLREWAEEAIAFYREAVRGDASSIEQEEIRVVLDYRSPAETVSIDPDLLKQAILNLVLNARDAMPSGGTITLVIDRSPGDWAAELAAEDEDRHFAEPTGMMTPPDFDELKHRPAVRFTVRDEGVGMDETVTDRAFEPFFSTKTRGKSTGLGLALVRAIIQSARGVTRIESKLGCGTAIHLDVPTALKTQARDQDGCTRSAGSAIIRISEPMAAAFVSSSLEQLGYDTRIDLHDFPSPDDAVWVVQADEVDPDEVRSVLDEDDRLTALVIGPSDRRSSWPKRVRWHDGPINVATLRACLADC